MNEPLIIHTDLSCLDGALCRGHVRLRCDGVPRRKVAVMELSSGAVKFLVPRLSLFDKSRRFDFSHYTRLSVNTPLSSGIMDNGEMDTDYYSRNVLPHIWHFRQDAARHGVTDIFTIATATYRQIANREGILDMISRDCGLSVSVLTSSEEACGVANAVAMSMTHCMVPTTLIIDHGKRSTEISILTPDGHLAVLGFDFGLTHLLSDCRDYLASGHKTSDCIRRLTDYIKKLDAHLKSVMYDGVTQLTSELMSQGAEFRLTGIGSPLTMSTGIKGARNYHGLTLSLSDLERYRLGLINAMNRAMNDTDKEINNTEELMQQYVGLAPYIVLMSQLNLTHITVCGASLWYGALHRAMLLGH